MRAQLVLGFLDELDIEIASRHANSGGYIPCYCPLAPWLHEKGADSNSSFFVKVGHEKISRWHCFTCKSSGPRLSSLARTLAYYREERLDSLAIRTDLAEIPDEFGEFDREIETVSKPEPLDKDLEYSMFPPAYEERPARMYLHRRGIHKAASDLMELRYDPEERRVLFPIMDRSQTLFGFSGRAIYPEAAVRHRDYGFSKHNFLLGEHLYQKGKPFWIVEGLFAYAHMIEIGARHLVNPVAPMMSSISKAQLNKLVGFGESVYLVFDPDRAGDIGLFGTPERDGSGFRGGGAVDRVKEHLPVFVPNYSEGLSDPDNMTYEQFEEMYHEADIS